MYGNNVVNLIGSISPGIDTFCANRYEMEQKGLAYTGRYIIIEYSQEPDPNIVPQYENETSIGGINSLFCLIKKQDGKNKLYNLMKRSSLQGNVIYQTVLERKTIEEINRVIDWLQFDGGNINSDLPEHYIGYDGSVWIKSPATNGEFVRVQLNIPLDDFKNLIIASFSSMEFIFDCGDSKN